MAELTFRYMRLTGKLAVRDTDFAQLAEDLYQYFKDTDIDRDDKDAIVESWCKNSDRFKLAWDSLELMNQTPFDDVDTVKGETFDDVEPDDTLPF